VLNPEELSWGMRGISRNYILQSNVRTSRIITPPNVVNVGRS
jgi:hypothetical protein